MSEHTILHQEFTSHATFLSSVFEIKEGTEEDRDTLLSVCCPNSPSTRAYHAGISITYVTFVRQRSETELDHQLRIALAKLSSLSTVAAAGWEKQTHHHVWLAPVLQI